MGKSSRCDCVASPPLHPPLRGRTCIARLCRRRRIRPTNHGSREATLSMGWRAFDRKVRRREKWGDFSLGVVGFPVQDL